MFLPWTWKVLACSLTVRRLARYVLSECVSVRNFLLLIVRVFLKTFGSGFINHGMLTSKAKRTASGRSRFAGTE